MSKLGATLLQQLVKVWPDPTRAMTQRFEADPESDEYNRRYTEEQFLNGVWFGSPLAREMPPVWGKRVLEIGCGHGGICCYLATLGAKSVVGVDLRQDHIEFGRRLAARLTEVRGNGDLPISFGLMDAHQLAFKDGSFDLIVADNVFEHFADPKKAMAELHRALAPGGELVIPIFSSIRSKWGLHLKHGIKLPWANLLFSEDSIVRTLKAESRRRPELLEYYPGLKGDPKRVADVRRYRDLNAITHEQFRQMASDLNFDVRAFKVHATRAGRIVRKALRGSGGDSLLEVLSTGAGAVLVKR